MSEVKCPKCGAKAECFYDADAGGVDYVDQYHLHCEHCGHYEEDWRYAGSPLNAINMETNFNCPYCHKAAYEHN